MGRDSPVKLNILKMTLKFSACKNEALIFKYLNEGHSPMRQFRPTKEDLVELKHSSQWMSKQAIPSAQQQSIV